MARRIGYWSRDSLFAGVPGWRETPTDEIIGNRLGACLEGGWPAGQADAVIFASTVISPGLWHGTARLKRLERRVQALTGCGTVLVCTGFRCVSWVHALVHAASHMEVRTVLLLIVDLELDDLNWLTADRSWGTSGEGILAALLDRDDADGWAGSVEQTPGGRNPVVDFAMYVKRSAAACDGGICGPFFAEAVARNYDMLARSETGSARYYDIYGHCFGADPWIALAHHGLASDPDGRLRLLPSMAINRYVGAVQVRHAASIELSNFDHLNGRFD